MLFLKKIKKKFQKNKKYSYYLKNVLIFLNTQKLNIFFFLKKIEYF